MSYYIVLLPNKKIKTHQERLIINHLRPYIENGQVVIGKLNLKEDIENLPRVISGPIDGSPAWYTDFPLPALLDETLPQPIYQLIIKEQDAIEVKKILEVIDANPADPEITFPQGYTRISNTPVLNLKTRYWYDPAYGLNRTRYPTGLASAPW